MTNDTTTRATMTGNTLSNPVPADAAVSKPAMDVLWTFLSCGIYSWFWKARQFRAINGFLGRTKYEFGMWFLLTLVTCGIYHVYTQYTIAQDLVDLQKRSGSTVSENLPVLSIVLSLFGLIFIVDMLHQNEINRLYGED